MNIYSTAIGRQGRSGVQGTPNGKYNSDRYHVDVIDPEGILNRS